MFLFVTLLIVVLAGGSDDASADEINARHKGHYKTSGDAWGVAVLLSMVALPVAMVGCDERIIRRKHINQEHGWS